MLLSATAYCPLISTLCSLSFFGTPTTCHQPKDPRFKWSHGDEKISLGALTNNRFDPEVVRIGRTIGMTSDSVQIKMMEQEDKVGGRPRGNRHTCIVYGRRGFLLQN